MKILVTLPTYNESENLEQLCKQICEAAEGLKNIDLHILVIDDNSPDGTGRIADILAKNNQGKIFAVHRSGKLGLGSAIMAGFDHAIANGYDFVINMDCDFSHDPADLKKFIPQMENFDLIIGSRHVKGGKIEGWNAKRRILHYLAQKYTNLVLGNYVKDHTNSYKAYRVTMLKALPLKEILRSGSGFVWHTMIIHSAHKNGFRICEVPTTFVDRRFGNSKMSKGEMVSGMLALLKFRFIS